MFFVVLFFSLWSCRPALKVNQKTSKLDFSQKLEISEKTNENGQKVKIFALNGESLELPIIEKRPAVDTKSLICSPLEVSSSDTRPFIMNVSCSINPSSADYFEYAICEIEGSNCSFEEQKQTSILPKFQFVSSPGTKRIVLKACSDFPLEENQFCGPETQKVFTITEKVPSSVQSFFDTLNEKTKNFEDETKNLYKLALDYKKSRGEDFGKNDQNILDHVSSNILNMGEKRLSRYGNDETNDVASIPTVEEINSSAKDSLEGQKLDSLALSSICDYITNDSPSDNKNFCYDSCKSSITAGNPSSFCSIACDLSYDSTKDMSFCSEDIFCFSFSNLSRDSCSTQLESCSTLSNTSSEAQKTGCINACSSDTSLSFCSGICTDITPIPSFCETSSNSESSNDKTRSNLIISAVAFGISSGYLAFKVFTEKEYRVTQSKLATVESEKTNLLNSNAFVQEINKAKTRNGLIDSIFKKKNGPVNLDQYKQSNRIGNDDVAKFQGSGYSVTNVEAYEVAGDDQGAPHRYYQVEIEENIIEGKTNTKTLIFEEVNQGDGEVQEQRAYNGVNTLPGEAQKSNDFTEQDRVKTAIVAQEASRNVIYEKFDISDNDDRLNRKKVDISKMQLEDIKKKGATSPQTPEATAKKTALDKNFKALGGSLFVTALATIILSTVANFQLNNMESEDPSLNFIKNLNDYLEKSKDFLNEIKNDQESLLWSLTFN